MRKRVSLSIFIFMILFSFCFSLSSCGFLTGETADTKEDKGGEESQQTKTPDTTETPAEGPKGKTIAEDYLFWASAAGKDEKREAWTTSGIIYNFLYPYTSNNDTDGVRKFEYKIKSNIIYVKIEEESPRYYLLEENGYWEYSMSEDNWIKTRNDYEDDRDKNYFLFSILSLGMPLNVTTEKLFTVRTESEYLGRPVYIYGDDNAGMFTVTVDKETGIIMEWKGAMQAQVIDFTLTCEDIELPETNQ